MLSPYLKHMLKLQNPQFYCNKYSNAHTNTLTSTQIYSQNTPTYHLSCCFSISITKQCRKPSFSSRLGCSTIWSLTISQSSAVVILVQPLFCQVTQTFFISLKLNITLNISHPIIILKTVNIDYLWKYSHLNSLAMINFILLIQL